MAESIDSLMVSLGLDTDKRSFDNGVAAFGQLRGAALSLAGALGLGVGGASLTTGFANSRQELGNFSRQMQVSAQSVRGLEFAFEQVGGQAGEARSAIESMVNFQDALRRGDTGAFDAMTMLGLDPRAILDAKDATQAIERTMQAMEGMDDQQRRIILQDMGINTPHAFRLFGEGADALNEYMNQAAQLAPVTQEQIDLANEVNKSLGELRQSFRGLADQVSVELLPQLLDLTNWTKDFLINNNDDIVEFIKEGPESYGRKYGDAARERIKEVFGGALDWLSNTPIRRGQGQEDETLGESLSGRQGPPSVGDISIRQGQNIFDNLEYRAAVAQAEREIGAPPGLLWAQIGQESSYNPYAVSSAGARGLAQIMPSTERSLEKRFGTELDPFDPMDSLRMQQELMRENFQATGNWDEALRMYHGGWDRSAWGPVNEAYAPSINRRREEMAGTQSSVSQDVTINIDGAGDPRAIAMEVDRVLRDHSERAANDFRSSVV